MSEHCAEKCSALLCVWERRPQPLVPPYTAFVPFDCTTALHGIRVDTYTQFLRNTSQSEAATACSALHGIRAV